MRLTPRRPRLAALVAAAAVMLIGVGLLGVEVRDFYPPPSPRPRVTAVPDSLTTSIVHTHDACAALSDHHLVAGDDLDGLGKKLTADENVTVFAASLGKAWMFKGAGLCDVGGVRTAHLLYTNGDDVVSIFSMPVPQMCHARQRASFAEKVENHGVVGFVNGDGLYCIVRSSAHGPSTIQDAQSLVPVVRAALPVIPAENIANGTPGATLANHKR